MAHDARDDSYLGILRPVVRDVRNSVHVCARPRTARGRVLMAVPFIRLVLIVAIFISAGLGLVAAVVT